ncbi:UNVERIFIED_CONTAM: hypothetical protein K2H54_046100 [Gekko kuhli]
MDLIPFLKSKLSGAADSRSSPAACRAMPPSLQVEQALEKTIRKAPGPFQSDPLLGTDGDGMGRKEVFSGGVS